MKPDHLSILLMRMRPVAAAAAQPLEGPWPPYVIFLSLSDGKHRAVVATGAGADFASAWKAASNRLRKAAGPRGKTAIWLRADWPEDVKSMRWGDLHALLESTKRNYFRHGISLDVGFERAFLEQELNANAMLYDSAFGHAAVNPGNFRRYAERRHKLKNLVLDPTAFVQVFATRGLFARVGRTEIHPLYPVGRDAGRRVVDQLTPVMAGELVMRGSEYLAAQVKDDGRFYYGWHPCFDREINFYNSLRHASSLYSMVEAWEVTRSPALKQAIDRALAYLTDTLIKTVEYEPGRKAAFLVDTGDEIKLGGNAVCLLALVKYSEVMGTDSYHGLLEKLALGILHMQDIGTGRFSHVLHYPSLEVKEAFRIIYYDGEAAFGLMRLYGLTRDNRWLVAVERAFEHFIAAKHWKAHDHWLSYCVNELTLYRPLKRYYEFGIQNFSDHLDFVIDRITTFPTLLELMMAAERMVARLKCDPALAPLLDGIDLDKFYRALHTRALYMLNGHFWPEYAMYFANPARIVGSFFIRHHAFRVRIDDVEHYLSGYAAYLRFLEEEKRTEEPNSAGERPACMHSPQDAQYLAPNFISDG